MVEMLIAAEFSQAQFEAVPDKGWGWFCLSSALLHLKPAGNIFVTVEHMEMSEFTDLFDRVDLFSLIGQVGKLFRFGKA
jgi:hypothetical protein